jgi:hypothetical protein
MLRGAPLAAIFVGGALDSRCFRKQWDWLLSLGTDALYCGSAVVGEAGAIIIPLIVAIRFSSECRAAKRHVHCAHRHCNK